MKAVIYCRVSTKDQAETFSLQVQEAKCREYCNENKLTVDGVFIEPGLSARNLNRPKLIKMLSHCAKRGSQIRHVVVYTLDRLSRDTNDYHSIGKTLSKVGVSVRSVCQYIDDTPSGKFLETVLAGAAQLDNDIRALKTREGMHAGALTGRWMWRPPIGYVGGAKPGPSLIPDRKTAPLIMQAFELIESGGKSKRQVLDVVSAQGFQTRKGLRVSIQSFNAILRNPIYVGRVVSPKLDVDTTGDFESLIPQRVFERVQAKLDGRAYVPSGHKLNREDFPLRRFVRCAVCQVPMTASWSRGRNGKKYPYYRCRNRKCLAVSTRGEELEESFVRLLGELQPDNGLLRLFREVLRRQWKQRCTRIRKLRRTLEDRRRDLGARKQRLYNALIEQGAIDQQTYEEQLERIRSDEEQVQRQLSELEVGNPEAGVVLDFATNLISRLGQAWLDGDLEIRLRLQAAVFPKGLEFAREGFGNIETSLVFQWLEAADRDNVGLASPTGFEPVSRA